MRIHRLSPRHSVTRTWMIVMTLVGILGLTPAARADEAHATAALEAAPGELVLEERLIAPCCWTQTLAGHESPLASQLRREIHTRLVAGEAPTAIESDFVERFGEGVRAVPEGRDPRKGIPVLVGSALLISGLLLAWALRRWLASSREAAARARTARTGGAVQGEQPSARDAYDDVIDAELRSVE